MKKKKKLYVEKKNSKDVHQEAQPSTATNTANLKKTPNSSNVVGKQMDAKEAAKKLIQSGVIKLDTSSKEKGFKRSSSRKDDIKKPINQESNDSFGPNRSAAYSSVVSPTSSQSSPFASSSSPYNTSANRYSSSDNSSYSPSLNQKPFNRMSSFQSNQYHQTPTSQSNTRFNNQQQGFQQRNGISLFIKANNVNEDLLRSLFNANVSQAKIISIDVKTNFAFVTVDSKESAELAIQELNGKTFQESLFSVSLARPRKPFQRNNSYNPNFQRQSSQMGKNDSPTFDNRTSASSGSMFGAASNANYPSNQDETDSGSRHIVNYEDI